jgi:hypothetical protein
MENQSNPKESLDPVYEFLEAPKYIDFSADVTGADDTWFGMFLYHLYLCCFE